MSAARRVRTFLAVAVLVGIVDSADARLVAQQFSDVDRQRSRDLIRLVRKDVERHYYDSTFHGIDISARFAAVEAQIAVAKSYSEVFSGIARIFLDLGDSHTYFVPPERVTSVDYGFELQAFDDSCFVSFVREGSDASAKGVRPGDVVLSVNGLAPARDNLWKMRYVLQFIRPRSEIQLVLRSPGAEPRSLDVRASTQQRRVVDLTGTDGRIDISPRIREAEAAVRLDRSKYAELENDVLVWRLRSFHDYDNRIEDGIARARKHKALILDLRANGGGEEDALLELLGHFFDRDVQVGQRVGRSQSRRLTAKGRGASAFTGQLIVVTDSETRSASEIFARAVQLTGRGTVIGDRTAGAVMRSRLFTHAQGSDRVILYGTRISDADVVMSDGKRLERTGVLPDVERIPTSADLRAGRDPVLADAAKLAGATLTPEAAGLLLRDR
ncbi:MAG TPA: S41 family peptidase [Gemmatimonadaceae bacterium]|nr:S41 family peptidase [Gemmatimonadaceae bacterium]